MDGMYVYITSCCTCHRVMKWHHRRTMPLLQEIQSGPRLYRPTWTVAIIATDAGLCTTGAAWFVRAWCPGLPGAVRSYVAYRRMGAWYMPHKQGRFDSEAIPKSVRSCIPTPRW